MKNLLACLVAVLISTSSMAEHHKSVEADVRAAVIGFNHAYATNDLDSYFGYYSDDVSMYYYGERQDIADYREEWHAMIDAGGGVEKNDASDVQVQVLPGDEVAIASYFVDNASRSTDGETSVVRAFETTVWQKIEGKWKVVNLHYTQITPED